MKRCLIITALATALLLTAATVRAKDIPQEPANQPELAIVVIDTLENEWTLSPDFDRIDLAFQYVAKERKWPVTIRTERLASNTPAHPIELRIFYLGVREDIGNDFKFRGWMILTVNGVKHDLGIITYRFTLRPWQNNDDAFERIFRGAANAAADKIEPLLFANVRTSSVSPSDAQPGK